MVRFTLLLLPLTLVSACRWSLDEPSTEPRVAQLYFPTGLLLDPGSRYLYVSNGNADLRYGGGTIQAIDLERFDCAYRAFRQGQGKGVAPIDKCEHWESDVASCVQDPFDPGLVDCDETPFIVRPSTIRVGNFAGVMKLKQIPGTRKRKLYAAVRGDPSLTWIDVDLDLLDAGKLGGLNCFDSLEAANAAEQPPACSSSRLIQLYCPALFIPPGMTVPPSGCVIDEQRLPIEPFAMVLDEQPARSLLVIAHLFGGEISLIDTGRKPESPPVLLSVSQPFFTPDATGRRGAFALAPQRPGDPSSSWYLTSNLQPSISLFRIAEANTVVATSDFSIGSTYPQGTDVRALVFEPGGQRAFVTESNPPSVVVIDTSPSRTNPAQAANQVVDVINVCSTPSRMELRQITVQGALGQPNRTVSRLYVSCYTSNQVMVLDPDAARVDETIVVGRGPNELVFNFGGELDNPDPAERRGYISNFIESTIGVIDLQPGSPTENRMVAKIGKQELPVSGP